MSHITIDFTQHQFVDEPAEFLPADPHDMAEVRMFLIAKEARDKVERSKIMRQAIERELV